MPKKPFIGKNEKTVTFKLVHRSQKDPLIASASERVWVPVSGSADPSLVENLNSRSGPSKSINRKEEQVKHGVYYDDDYDYLQHLRDVNEVVSTEMVEAHRREPFDLNKGLILPSSIFGSSGAELKVGLLNQAAPHTGPRPDLDPDIIATLDDESENFFDFDDPENQLEDDFVAKANAVPDRSVDVEMPDIDEENEECGSDYDNRGSVDEDDMRSFGEEETKSRFTNYSMTSSVMRRTEGLQDLDARFEKLYEEYDDSEIGSLDSDDSESDESADEPANGTSSQQMKQLLKEYKTEKNEGRNWSKVLGKYEPGRPLTYNDEPAPIIERVIVGVEPDGWDCESIISTYSNLYNRPSVIDEKPKKIRIDPKTGLPLDTFRTPLTSQGIRQLDKSNDLHSVRSHASIPRPKDETPEQRRARKQLIKQERRERRCEKKANQEAFKEEARRQKHIEMNLQTNVQRLKLT